MRHLFPATALAFAGALLLGAPFSAMASDMPAIPIPEPLPLPAGGWYLRGDIGYKFYQDPDGYYDLAGYEDMFSTSINDTGLIGAGVGYRFNDYFRMDATIDYEFGSRISGTLPCPACAAGGSTESADIAAWTGLINGYAELGNFNGFSPYLGAGIGWSLLQTSDAKSSSPGSYSGDDTWNFAWALMAGVGYEMSDQLTVDVGYRYLDLGDARTKAPAGTPGSGVIEWNDIAAHEIRVGMRYTFN